MISFPNKKSIIGNKDSNRFPIDPSLEELMLQSHVRFWLQSDASAKDVSESRTLLGESIDYRGSGRG